MIDIFHYVAIQFKSCIGMNKSIVWYIGGVVSLYTNNL